MIDNQKFIEKYKPEKVKILFVTEAPGKPGKHFYRANTNLYRTIFAAFKALYGDFDSSEEFLQFFKNTGCFLDHLTLEPVEKLDPKKRKKDRQKGVLTLSERFNEYQLETLIILMKAIEPQVQQAVNLSGIKSILHQAVTSYPAGSEKNRLDCIETLKKVLKVAIEPDFDCR